ncbi:hypothetical protein ACH4TX_03290 [Streptomyces sp. NPDC021098]|uniref:hypothetical protein n=1 Tax=unclassified Streptomyces TaxID=2593676 RepID=UPI003791E563
MTGDFFAPGSSGMAQPTRKKYISLTIALGLVTFLVASIFGYYVGFVGDTKTQESRTKTEQDVEDKLDQEEKPFTGTIDYDRSEPENWTVVLDRTLTAAEQKQLSAMIPYTSGSMRKARAFLTSLGGRTLRFPTTLENNPTAFNNVGTDSTAFTMNLFSKRNTQLSIIDMKAGDISCREPSAKSVFVFPPQGEASYTGILYDLTQPDFAPLITDPGKDQARPYFSRKRMDLGGGESPGGFRIEAVTRGKTCTWDIKARYRDANQQTGEVTLKDGKKPFVAEASPARPQQLWYVDMSAPTGQNWVPCHEKPENVSCRAWWEEHTPATAER